ncbi:MAG: hypothetical protein A2Z20_00935 [Bdellovibrionales bacterium RBG_16_40_8]|nr:MAG: hypothetical protein A2Z20_00935 [Bdellovibrionales bacterium RBG_16_40_8]
MIFGRIKCYFQSRGYGYIEDFSGREVYFYYTSVEGAAPCDIVNGASVCFEVISTGIGLEAQHVKISNML